MSPDGRFIISGSDDRTVRLWEIESGQWRVLFWNDALILSLALAPDGGTLACGDGVGRVWIFEWVHEAPTQLLSPLNQTKTGDADSELASPVCCSPHP